jgi:hypothetical protein
LPRLGGIHAPLIVRGVLRGERACDRRGLAHLGLGVSEVTSLRTDVDQQQRRVVEVTLPSSDISWRSLRSAGLSLTQPRSGFLVQDGQVLVCVADFALPGEVARIHRRELAAAGAIPSKPGNGLVQPALLERDEPYPELGLRLATLRVTLRKVAVESAKATVIVLSRSPAAGTQSRSRNTGPSLAGKGSCRPGVRMSRFGTR